ncbi:DUF4160 domain-containing protein [Arthrobacter glacialis]|uniref:DUF4160 domain-containing protein n=1 Tax=Arthrobacter glacialis TaxID=1664 RepID=UPI0013FD3123|nr:DUF4160 domain-containing protein [Arthrobacter glacialis]
MSKDPGDIFRHQEQDLPVTLYTQADWDDADANGLITAAHVLDRLHRMLEFALGNENPNARFDEEGFVVALVAASIKQDKIKLTVYTNDHNPPHCHVDVKGESHGKLRIDLSTGEFMEDVPKKIKSQQTRIMTLFTQNQEALSKLWDGYQSNQS